MKKTESELSEFDKVMDGLMAVPYKELQEKLAEEKKTKAQKKRAKTSPASRASAVRKS